MKTLRDAVSYSYCRNHLGWDEVTIKFKPTILDKLFRDGKGKEYTFVNSGRSKWWFLKNDFNDVDSNQQELIDQVIRESLYYSQA